MLSHHRQQLHRSSFFMMLARNGCSDEGTILRNLLQVGDVLKMIDAMSEGVAGDILHSAGIDGGCVATDCKSIPTFDKKSGRIHRIASKIVGRVETQPSMRDHDCIRWDLAMSQLPIGNVFDGNLMRGITPNF